MQNIRNFVIFFLKSISPVISDFFLIDIDCIEKDLNGRLFYLSIPSSALMIQENLNLKLLSCRNINHLPKYLMIYLDREENGQRFQTNYISVD